MIGPKPKGMRPVKLPPVSPEFSALLLRPQNSWVSSHPVEEYVERHDGEVERVGTAQQVHQERATGAEAR